MELSGDILHWACSLEGVEPDKEWVSLFVPLSISFTDIITLDRLYKLQKPADLNFEVMALWHVKTIVMGLSKLVIFNLSDVSSLLRVAFLLSFLFGRG